MEPTTVTTLSATTFSIGIILILGAYLLGSLSSAILYCRLFKHPDPRHGGSGNPGATNVLRLYGKGAAACVLFGDLAKGVIPVLLARLFELDALWVGLTGCAVLLGHLFPVFFHFHGGKGIATAAGICLAFSLPFGLAVIAVWVIVLLITRISSLAALSAAGAAPIFGFIFLGWELDIFVLIIVLLLIWRHKGNIQRLREGTEPKIGNSGTK
jgi:glycerol-3-phosphate acyltransferase PlsY